MCNLAEAVAGQRIDEGYVSTVVPVEELFRLRQKLKNGAEPDFYHTWARWFFADNATRTISPWSRLTVAITAE